MYLKGIQARGHVPGMLLISVTCKSQVCLPEKLYIYDALPAPGMPCPALGPLECRAGHACPHTTGPHTTWPSFDLPDNITAFKFAKQIENRKAF